MRAEQDTQDQPEQNPPKLEKEKLRDLDLDHEAAEGIRGGAVKLTGQCNVAGGGAGAGDGS